MYHEGDLKPVVKRVRPYKTLLINLPAKSFGFWVLANTKIDACFTDEKYHEAEVDDVVSISEEPEIEDLKTKRSINVEDYEEYTNSADISVDFCDENDVTEELRNKDLRNRVNDIKRELSQVEALFKVKPKQEKRTKRQTDKNNPKGKIRKFIQHGLKNRNIQSEPEPKSRGLLGNLLQSTKQNISRLLKGDRLYKLRQLPLFNKNKFIKRQSDSKPKKTLNKRKENNLLPKESLGKKQIMKMHKAKEPQQIKNNIKEIYKLAKESAEQNINKVNNKDKPKQNKNTHEELTKVVNDSIKEKVRTRRNTKDQVDLSTENEIDINDEDNTKLWKMLRKIHKQFKDLSEEPDEYVEEGIDYSEGLINTKRVNDKDDNVDLGDVDTTFIKSTVYNLLRVISDLNKNLNRFWNGMRILD